MTVIVISYNDKIRKIFEDNGDAIAFLENEGLTDQEMQDIQNDLHENWESTEHEVN